MVLVQITNDVTRKRRAESMRREAMSTATVRNHNVLT